MVHAQDSNGNAVLTPISQLKIGDKVLAKSEWKPENESLSYEPITDIISTPDSVQKWVHLTLANGNPINRIDPTGEFGLVGAGIGAGLDLALQLIENGGNLGCVNWHSVLTSGVMGAFTGGFAGATKNGITGVTKVARWGREGLREGDWVVEGGVNRFNYFRTGKWEKHAGNEYSPYSTGQSFPKIPKVSSNDLRYPAPFWKYPDGGWKGFFVGQLQYSPNSLGIPAWKLDLAKNATGMTATGVVKMDEGIGNPICGCQ